MKHITPFAVFFSLALTATVNGQTVVRMSTSLGDVDIRLFESESPINTQNFLNYVLSGRYNNTVLHRADPGFVLQGGSFTWDGSAVPLPAPGSPGGFGNVDTDPPVVSEADTNGLSNVRGTIAFALSGGNPNSATSGFFFNVSDNAALDSQGFTVFGEVIGDGMTIVDNIMGQPTVNREDAWGSFVFANIPTTNGTDAVMVLSVPEPASFLIASLLAAAAVALPRRRC